ncbi:MAG: hypothetical protein K0U72_01635 [Gammaproteobacteria bacterium]|nr:hypothetical protein [Gammaproteobacteria bacterium]
MVPAPLKTRLALILARLLLVCIGQILNGAPLRSAGPDADNPEGDAATANEDSAAIKMARFARRRYTQAKSYCKNTVSRVRTAHQASTERAESKLQTVLGEVDKSWQELQDRVVLSERQRPRRDTTPTAHASSTPSWADDVRARSRVAMAAQATTEPQSTNSETPSAESAVQPGDTRAIDEPRSRIQRSEPNSDAPVSHHEELADSPVARSSRARSVTERRPRSKPAGADPATNQLPPSVAEISAATGDVVDEPIATLPDQLRRAPFHSTDVTAVAQAKERGTESAAYSARQWPELPLEGTQPATRHAANTANLWPALPEDPILERSAPAETRATTRAIRQRALEQEQRGETWNG